VGMYCRGLKLDGFGAESSEAGSYVCGLDGRHFSCVLRGHGARSMPSI
jgi:hypothetical protein